MNRRKLLSVVAGLAFSMVLLEAGLRLFSSGYMAARNVTPAPKTGRVIVCIGDSFTFGTGASKGHSYPDQLQAMLGTRATVINRGVPGNNSSETLAQLKEISSELRPDTVILLTGRNNFWNFNGYSDFSGDGNHYWHNALYNLKTYRLVLLLEKRIAEKMAYAKMMKAARVAGETATTAKPRPDVNRPKNRQEAMNDTANLYLSAGQAGPAEKVFKDVLIADRRNVTALTGLSSIYRKQGKKKELLSVADRLIESKSDRPEPYRIAADIFYENGETEKMRAACFALLALYPGDIDAIFRIGHSYSSAGQLEPAYAWYKAHQEYLSAPALKYPFFNTALSMGINYWNEARKTQTGTSRATNPANLYKKAEVAYLDAITANPAAFEAYQGLALTYSSSNRPDDALRAIEDGLKILPQKKADFQKLLANIIHMSAQNPDFLKRANAVLSGNQAGYERHLSTSQIGAWLSNDIENMARFCSEHKIKLLLLNYPPQPEDVKSFRPEYDLVKSVTDNISGSRHLIYVDIYAIFHEISRHETDMDKYFIPDGHCNDAGYRIMADSIHPFLSSPDETLTSR